MLMMLRLLTALVAALALMAASELAIAQPTLPPGPHADPEVQPAVPNARGRPVPAQQRASHAAAIALERASPEEIAGRMSPPSKGAPLQVAFGRDVAATQSEGALRSKLEWEPLPDGGQVAAVSLASPGASALRVGLGVISIPAEAILRFRTPQGADMFEVTGEEIVEIVARNLEAGDDPAQARMYWSPIVEADTAIVEIELPPGSREQDLRLAIPQVSHFVAAPHEEIVEKVSACQVDAVCSDATWGTESLAVGRLLFVIGGSGFACTGTLLADQDASTTIPYLLSANHCIGSQTVASTLQVTWKYRSTSCNAGAASSYPTTAGGAQLLYATGTTDTSFMKLNNAPAAGVTYAGWFVGSPPSLNTAITGLHNPGGGLEKISFGNIFQYATCMPSGANTFTCDTASTGTATFIAVLWSQGLTEGGSSGSGLFLNSGHYLIGQLYGGSSLCGSSSGPDFYGRFDRAYNAALSQWLAAPQGPPPTTLNVSKGGAGTGTVTSNPAGISCGSTCSAPFAQGAVVALTAAPSVGSVFAGWSGACSGTGSCSVTMNGSTSATATFNTAPPLALSAVLSRKTHGAVTYDLPIDVTQPVTGAVTVDPRTDNTHRIAFRFNNPLVSTGIVTVTDATGAPLGAATVAIAGSEIVVTLSGVDDRRVRVAIAGVNGALSVAASVGFLAGDENSSGAVTASDLLRIRGRLGQAAGTGNFPYDVDRDGNVTNNDLGVALARSGSSLR